MKADCVILSGGKSSRMLRDKAFLKFKGKPLVEYAINLSVKIFPHILVSVKNDEQKQKIERITSDVEIIKDEQKNYSPMIGIKSILKHLKHDNIFILSCDMPFIQETTINRLLSRFDRNIDCIVYKSTKKYYEPFCALYNKNIFNRVDNNDSFQKIINNVNKKIVIPIKGNEIEFFNINTNEDLKLAVELSQFR